MKTGDLYLDENGSICIYFRGNESAFTSEGFHTDTHHASLRQQVSQRESIFMFNCTDRGNTPLNLNITEILNDPDVLRALKTNVK